jgi:CRISPR system Cascade subunit CasE
MPAEPLYMLRLCLDTAGLFELGRRRHLPLREVDVGYLAHCALGELFGEGAPKPFHLENGGRAVSLLAYSPAPAEELRRRADTFATPEVHALCDWKRLAAKLMPTAWEAGARYGFRVRACPVVRMSSDGERHRRGAEVDAFLARCWEVGDGIPVDRETVYREWLTAELERRGGAGLRAFRLASFQRERLVRRAGADRRVAIRERPDATMEGVIEVNDGAAFGELLRRGIGRHRSFGFGMLMLRPAPPC